MASLQGSGQIPHEAVSGERPGPKGGLSLWTRGCGPEGSVPEALLTKLVLCPLQLGVQNVGEK